MTNYRTSKGLKISKSNIDRLVHNAKAIKLKLFYEEHGYFFCEECKKNEYASGRIDCAHIVSVKKCQEEGRSELAYDVDNLRLLCRQCHQIHDKLI